MAPAPPIELAELLKNVPRGAWVAISHDTRTLLAYGSDMRLVLDQAREKGDHDPIIARVPEYESALFF